MRLYEFAAVALLMIVLLTWDYFKQGTLVIAAKYFHHKDYDRTERVLLQIIKPTWLGKNRRGFFHRGRFTSQTIQAKRFSRINIQAIQTKGFEASGTFPDCPYLRMNGTKGFSHTVFLLLFESDQIDFDGSAFR